MHYSPGKHSHNQSWTQVATAIARSTVIHPPAPGSACIQTATARALFTSSRRITTEVELMEVKVSTSRKVGKGAPASLTVTHTIRLSDLYMQPGVGGKHRVCLLSHIAICFKLAQFTRHSSFIRESF